MEYVCNIHYLHCQMEYVCNIHYLHFQFGTKLFDLYFLICFISSLIAISLHFTCLLTTFNLSFTLMSIVYTTSPYLKFIPSSATALQLTIVYFVLGIASSGKSLVRGRMEARSVLVLEREGEKAKWPERPGCLFFFLAKMKWPTNL